MYLYPVSKKRPPFYFLNNSVKNLQSLIIFGTLNAEKNWHEHLNLSHVATLPWEIQKKSFSTLLFIYFRLFTLAQKKTSSNCCSAALAVYLLLLTATPHEFMITGDFNIHLDNPADTLTSQFLSLLSSFNLSQHVH